MKIYIIRHGETESNALGIKQGTEGNLSVRGKLQVEAVAHQMKDVSIDKIICSPYPRTKESADIISQVVHAPMEYSELFEERKNPPEIIGIDKNSDKTLTILKQIEENAHDPEWRFSTEENFHDLISRSHNALNFLENQNVENILVISHGYFIRTFLVALLLNNHLTPDVFYQVHKKLPIMNASVSEIELVKRTSGEKFWRILTINNHRHLVDKNLMRKKNS